MFVVGVTGGIGSGKSAVTNRFEQLGIEVVDADLASRAVVEPGTDALKSIEQHFGQHILLPDKSLDRAKLRQAIFSDPEQKKWLEALLHPLIAQHIKSKLLASKSPYTVFVSPLLIEANQDRFCNHILVIDVPEHLQIKRTIERDNNDESQVRRIIKSQVSRKQRIDRADDIIENIHGLQELEQKVDQLHQQYLLMSANKNFE